MTTDTTPRLLALVRSLEAEHGPGGWPAVEMATLSGLADAVERHAARVASLEAELVAARRDADRYRWLCANNFDRQGVKQIHTWLQTWEPHSQTGEPTEWTQRIRGGRLDEVIDAAMATDARWAWTWAVPL